MLVCVKIRAKLCSKLIRAIYWLTRDRLAAYLQSGSFFQLVGMPILYTGIEDEQKSNKAFTLSRIELQPLTVLQR